MASFRLAVDQGADALELDCQTTRDGRLVVLHDLTLDRTTNGTGSVSQLTLDEVRRLDAGSWKSSDFAGESIPTLTEVARLARTAGVGLVVEAKTPYELDPTLAERIVAELDREGVLSRSVIQCFDHRPLARLHQRRPEVKLGPLVDAGIDQVAEMLSAAGTWAYLPSFKYMFPDRVRRAQQLGYKVCVWTVDKPEYMLAMIRRGVDGIMTNHPARLRELLDSLALGSRDWPR